MPVTKVSVSPFLWWLRTTVRDTFVTALAEVENNHTRYLSTWIALDAARTSSGRAQCGQTLSRTCALAGFVMAWDVETFCFWTESNECINLLRGSLNP